MVRGVGGLKPAAIALLATLAACDPGLAGFVLVDCDGGAPAGASCVGVGPGGGSTGRLPSTSGASTGSGSAGGSTGGGASSIGSTGGSTGSTGGPTSAGGSGGSGSTSGGGTASGGSTGGVSTGAACVTPVPLQMKAGSPSPSGTDTYGAIVADINHDGLDDLALGEAPQNNAGGGAYVYFSLGDGGFTVPEVPINPNVYSLAYGNFAPGARPALAATQLNSGTQYILEVMPLFEDGSVDTSVPCPNPTCQGGQEYWGQADSDLLGQPIVAALPVSGQPDAVIATTAGDEFLQVFEQGYEEPGTLGADDLSTFLFEASGGAIGPLVVGDLNGDGRPDVVVVQSNELAQYGTGPATSADQIWTLIQTTPTNPPWPSVAPTAHSTGTGSKPSAAALGDFDQDGNLDVAVACYGAIGVQLFSNDGQGDLTLGAFLPMTNPPVAIAVGDFNGDGWPDIAALWDNGGSASGGGVDVFLNQHCSFAAPTTLFLSDASPTFLLAGHLHPGDGGTDLAVVDYDASIVVLLNGH